MRRPTLIILILAYLFIIGCEQNPSDPDDTISQETIDKIGQMVIVGFRGTEIFDTSSIVADIESLNIGGVVLYEYDSPSHSRPRNIESPTQLSALVSDLKTHADTPLLIAIDQEGGFVDRLKESYGFPPTVTAQHLGEVDDPETTTYWANSCATTLEEMGINLNFAPVVDLNINPDCPPIGHYERSFSANPSVVIDNATIWIDQHHNRGILCAIKHFPGHGSSTEDSHLGIVDITETWSEIELEPFDSLISAGKPDLVMTAHVFNRDIDPDYPATLSGEFIDGMLRGDLSYNGVVIADDMQMGAIQSEYGLYTAVEKSINAGVDILIFSNNYTEYNPNAASEFVDAVVWLIEEGRITEERIDESYSRIMTLKSSI